MVDKKNTTFRRRNFAQAEQTIVRWQKYAGYTLLVGLVAAGIFNWRIELLVINGMITAFYLVSSVYRVFLIDLSLRNWQAISVETTELNEHRSQWPPYLVLVPLYQEADVLPSLIANLRRLDYPRDKLDIRLLVEEDDDETLTATREMALEEPFSVVVVSDSYPKTKPKACNVGLEGSDARYCVIYDAEDRPEPDQLKKAVLAYDRSPEEVACVQAKLNFYNPDQNALTRCFAAEYAMWFDMFLPGLDALHAPIPLGGTSNHFRLDVLLEIGGWDPYNVTEDCDVGLRMFTRGWRTRIIDSTTWEQACPSLQHWIRQRSRWTKGFIQTYLVHTRRPFRQMIRLGISNYSHFQLVVGGTILCQLVNPVYWTLTLLWFVFKTPLIAQFFPGAIFAMGVVCLFVGNFTFAYCSAVACVRRGLGHLTGYGLLMPAYWALMSYAAWKGTLQLIRRPHYWEKTRHYAADAAVETEGIRQQRSNREAPHK